MSMRMSVRSFSVVALCLATTGVALARTPPALVQSRAAQGFAAAASGYRDSLARSSAARPEPAAERGAAGYRDSLIRFASRGTSVRVASR